MLRVMKTPRFVYLSLALIFGTAAIIFWQTSPNIAMREVKAALASLDTAAFNPENAMFQNGSLIFNDIALDTNGFSRLGQLRIESPRIWTFFQGGLGRVSVKDLRLTGTVDNTGRISVSGFEHFDHRGFYALLADTEKLEVENARIDLDLPALGGVQALLNLDMQADGNTLKGRGTFISQQALFSLDSDIFAVIDSNARGWELQMALNDAALSKSVIAIKRVYGDLSAAGQDDSLAYLSLQAQAGALSYRGYNTQSISATLDHKNSATHIVAEAKALPEGESGQPIEISLIYDGAHSDEPQITFFAEETSQLETYLRLGQKKTLQNFTSQNDINRSHPGKLTIQFSDFWSEIPPESIDFVHENLKTLRKTRGELLINEDNITIK